MKNDLIAIVTPIGNELESIMPMYQELQKISWHLWITVIDSFCQDGSDTVLRELSKHNPRIVVLHIGSGTGVARAYIRGVQRALELNATKIVEVDVGHPVNLIPEFIEALDQFPLVTGTRLKRGGGFINVKLRRRLLSKWGTALSHLMLQLPFSDCTSGLQGFSRQVAESMPFDQFQSTGHFYQTEFKFYCQSLPFMEIPFIYVGTESSVKTSAIRESLCILFRLSRQHRSTILKGDYTPMPNEREELLMSIKKDLQRLVGNETHIVSYHLQCVLHRVLVRVIRLIE